MFNATRHHEHVAWVQDDVAIAKLNGQLPTDEPVRLPLRGDRGKSVLNVADIVCQTPNPVGAALSDTL